MYIRANRTRKKQSGEEDRKLACKHETPGLLDNRVAAITQRKFQRIAALSPRVALAKQLQAVVDRRSNGDRQAQGRGQGPDKTGVQQPAIQLAPWSNAPARFRTDNEDDKVPNSEYLVTAGGYRRYAPINKVRAPGQMYHEGPRSFLYIPPANMSKVARSANRAVPVGGDQVHLKKGRHTLTAFKNPANGRVVWDADVNNNGVIGSGRHVGHAVEDLGAALPTLDDPDKLEKAREQQENVQIAQDIGYLKGDMFYVDLYYALEEGRDTMEDGTLITPELAHDAMRRLANIREQGLESPDVARIAHALMVHLANQ